MNPILPPLQQNWTNLRAHVYLYTESHSRGRNAHTREIELSQVIGQNFRAGVTRANTGNGNLFPGLGTHEISHGTCESLARRQRIALDKIKGLHWPSQPHHPKSQYPETKRQHKRLSKKAWSHKEWCIHGKRCQDIPEKNHLKCEQNCQPLGIWRGVGI